MNKRQKPFPWGMNSLFYNPKVRIHIVSSFERCTLNNVHYRLTRTWRSPSDCCPVDRAEYNICCVVVPCVMCPSANIVHESATHSSYAIKCEPDVSTSLSTQMRDITALSGRSVRSNRAGSDDFSRSASRTLEERFGNVPSSGSTSSPYHHHLYPMRVATIRLPSLRSATISSHVHRRAAARLLASRASYNRRRSNSTLAAEAPRASGSNIPLHVKPSHQHSPFASQGCK